MGQGAGPEEGRALHGMFGEYFERKVVGFDGHIDKSEIVMVGNDDLGAAYRERGSRAVARAGASELKHWVLPVERWLERSQCGESHPSIT